MHQNQTPWELPNPFIKPDGNMVRTVEEWPQQQAYLKQILAENLYGVMPPAPGNVTAEKKYEQSLWDGTGIFESYELSFGPYAHGADPSGGDYSPADPHHPLWWICGGAHRPHGGGAGPGPGHSLL